MLVLRGNGYVQAQCVTKLQQITGARSLPQHLLHGITRHDVDEQKDERHDQPQRGKRKQEPQ
jgi:hypothetical protein